MLGLVVREELGLHRRHVDAQRALALARLALEAEVEDLVQPLVAERLARVRLRERLDERVGAPAGGVLLLAGGHVGRAHHALAGLAAGADALAAVGGVAHAAAEVEVGLERQRGRQRRVAEALRERWRVDHHARVEAPVGVEQRLDLAERLVELVAEHARVERAADAAVAVLRRVDAVELRHQRGDLVGDGGHRLDALRRRQVDERADVQAADAAVAVEAGAQPVAVEDGAERLDVVAEARGRHRGVLDEGRGPPGALAGRHQQAEAGLADLGQRVLLGGGLGAQEVVAVAVLAPRRLQLVELRAGPVGRVGEEGDEQQRAGLALDRARHLRELVLRARQLEDRRVDHLDRRGLEVERVLGGGDRLVDAVEVTDRELARLRQLDQVDRRLGDGDERALAAGDELGEVEVAGERVEPVAAGLAPVVRVVLGDGALVPAEDLRQAAVDGAFERVRLGAPGPLGFARPGRGWRSSRRTAPPAARGRGRSSCRRRSSGCPTSCCRSCRRASPGWRSRCPGRSRGRGA